MLGHVSRKSIIARLNTVFSKFQYVEQYRILFNREGKIVEDRRSDYGWANSLRRLISQCPADSRSEAKFCHEGKVK